MQMGELLNSVQYVTDQHGQKKGVLLDLESWHKLVQHIEQYPQSNAALLPELEQAEAAKVKLGTQIKREAAMAQEENAFREMHPMLHKQYAGQYVAIYKKQLIDSDSDQVALYRRVRKEHPGEFVWIAPVKETADEIIRFRSPRFQNNHS